MDVKKIKMRADELYEKLDLSQAFFVHVPEIENYLRELTELENQCSHEYLNGKCIYCRKEMNKDNG